MNTIADYRERPHWSYSALNQFFNICALQYYFERIVRLPRPFTPLSLAFGTVWHRVMEHIALTRMEGEPPSASEAADLFQTAFERQVEDEPTLRFDNDTDADSCALQGRAMCACYVSGINPEERLIGVSEAFCVPLVDASGFVLETPLVGEIDCVMELEGHVRLVDWKTAARRWPTGKALKDWQPTAYLLGYTNKHGLDQIPAFKYEICTKGAKPVYEEHLTGRSENDFHRLASFARLAEAMIAADHIAPNEQGFYCGGCPYQDACKTWHRDLGRIHVRMAA